MQLGSVRGGGGGLQRTPRVGSASVLAGFFAPTSRRTAAAAARSLKADQMGCTRSVISLCRLRVSVSTAAADM